MQEDLILILVTGLLFLSFVFPVMLVVFAICIFNYTSKFTLRQFDTIDELSEYEQYISDKEDDKVVTQHDEHAEESGVEKPTNTFISEYEKRIKEIKDELQSISISKVPPESVEDDVEYVDGIPLTNMVYSPSIYEDANNAGTEIMTQSREKLLENMANIK